MSCTKHFLGFTWERHAWQRRVAGADTRWFVETDKWGRQVTLDHVTCHIQYECAHCGAIRAGEECGCDLARAEVCPARLAYLAKQPAETPAISA